MEAPCSIVGAGCISAAGHNRLAHHRAYAENAVCWSVDVATGLPVYRIQDLPRNTDIEAFARRYQPDRSGLLALHAAGGAVAEAGWEDKDFSILVGCSRGPTEAWESHFTDFLGTGVPALKTSPKTTLGSIGFTLARYFGVERGIASSMSVTCSSGFHALVHGVALLRSGMAERVLVGGTEAPLTTFTLRQMERLGVYASVPDGDHACRPLANPPSGMVLGEGAGFLALERRSKGLDGSGILGIGFAREHGRGLTGISKTGEGLRHAMRMATDGRRPDVIIPHAPGTPAGDAAEMAAIKSVFGDAPPSIQSYKWATGHTFGASGPLALVAGLDEGSGGRVLVNATGFGGNVVSVLVSRPDTSPHPFATLWERDDEPDYAIPR